MAKSNAGKVRVESRAVYEHGKRRHFVYDALYDGVRVTADSRKEAIALALAEHAYLEVQPEAKHNGCRLYALGLNSWCFELCSGTPRASSMVFGATDFAKALEIARRDYSDHPDCVAFFLQTTKGSVLGSESRDYTTNERLAMGGGPKTPEENVQITTRDHNLRDDLRWQLGKAFMLAPSYSKTEELVRLALVESFGSDERAAEYLESNDFGVVAESEQEESGT